jgi:hypothetical protein
MRDYDMTRRENVAYTRPLAPRLIERLGWPTKRLATDRVRHLRELVLRAMDTPRGIATDQAPHSALAEVTVQSR